MSQIGKNIKKNRSQKGITQDQLAEHLNVTRQAVSNWENGKTQPDIETLTAIAAYFGISVEDLIYGKQNKWIVQTKTHAATGIGFGAALAMIISYTHWQSIGWAIIHGILGWVYVLYYIIKY